MSQETSRSFLLATSGESHLAGAALFRGNHLLSAVRQESLTGIKSDSRYPPTEAVTYVLNAAGISQAEVSHTVVMEPNVGISRHRAEAEIAFTASGFGPEQRTLVAVMDLEEQSTGDSFWICEQGGMQHEATNSSVEGLRHFYQVIGDHLGESLENLWQFTTKRKFLEKGVIPVLEQQFRRIFHQHVGMDMQTGGIHISRALEKELAIVIVKNESYSQTCLRKSLWVAGIDHLFSLEKSLFEQKLSKTGATHLCLAGGFALSAEFNSFLVESGLVETDAISITPFPCGIASYVGAGLARLREQHVSVPKLEGISWSRTYDVEELKEEVGRAGLTMRAYQSDEALCEAAAQCIVSGQVIGWFQGGAELGPRALGNRSILGNYSDAYGNRRLNRVKKAVLHKETAIALDDGLARDIFSNYHHSPYMQYLQYYKPEHGVRHPHLAIATRPHMVTEQQNPIFWRLLEHVGKKTGMAAVYKSSLNVSGKPPAENPAQALKIFEELDGLDVMVLGSLIISRE